MVGMRRWIGLTDDGSDHWGGGGGGKGMAMVIKVEVRVVI